MQRAPEAAAGGFVGKHATLGGIHGQRGPRTGHALDGIDESPFVVEFPGELGGLGKPVDDAPGFHGRQFHVVAGAATESVVALPGIAPVSDAGQGVQIDPVAADDRKTFFHAISSRTGAREIPTGPRISPK